MDANQEQHVIQAILASGVKIPPMPAVMMAFMALEKDADAPLENFCTVLNRDAALTGALFRVANSPLFGGRKVTDLQRALATVGIKNAGAIVRSESMRRALNDPGYMAFMNLLWARLDAIADVSVRLVKRLHVPYLPTDLVYLLGIFHDAGLAVLCKRFESYARGFARFDAWPDVPALDQAHQTSHAVVGQMLARNWQLPPGLVQAIRHHHEPEAFGTLPEVVVKMILVLQFAVHLYNLAHRQSDAEWDQVWRAGVLARFELTPQALAEVEADLLEDTAHS